MGYSTMASGKANNTPREQRTPPPIPTRPTSRTRADVPSGQVPTGHAGDPISKLLTFNSVGLLAFVGHASRDVTSVEVPTGPAGNPISKSINAPAADVKLSPQGLSVPSPPHEMKTTPKVLLSPIQEVQPVVFPVLDGIATESHVSHSNNHSSQVDHPSPLEEHSRVNPDPLRSRPEKSTREELRQRFKSASEPTTPQKCDREDESYHPLGPRSNTIEHLETVAELEELEVTEFLRRSSKYLREIDIQTSEPEYVPPPIPELNDFRSTVSGKVDWVAFWDAYAAAQFERYCPSGLITSSNRAPVSMSQLKSHAARCYVTILPELWRLLLGSSICRWHNPRRAEQVKYLGWNKSRLLW